MGASKPKTAKVYTNAPSSVAAATVDNATADARDVMRDKLKNQRGREYTNKTAGMAIDQVKKALLGE